MKRLTLMTLACMLLAFFSCNQTAEDRYQRYLEEVADSSEIEFIERESDPVEYVEDDGYDPLADDGGLIAIPDIPQERRVDMSGNDYEVERMMMGK